MQPGPWFAEMSLIDSREQRRAQLATLTTAGQETVVFHAISCRQKQPESPRNEKIEPKGFLDLVQFDSDYVSSSIK